MDILAMGGTADILTPAMSFISKAAGKTEQITIPLEYMVDVELYLKQEQFPIFNTLIVGDVFCFDVLKPHYQTVIDLLCWEFGLEQG